MLVLARNAKQKIVFPNLGIVIKVVDIKGKYVRLGVDAPKEIRVLREELADGPSQTNRVGYDARSSLDYSQFQQALPETCSDEDSDRIEVLVRQLDTANLAIHLAQNQLRQGRTEFADASLQHAIDCLNEMEASAGLISHDALHAVREPSVKYRVGRQLEALILGGNHRQRKLVIEFLREAGINVSRRDSMTSLQLLNAVQSGHSRPDLVLLLEPRNVIFDIQSPLLLKLGSLNGLTQRTKVEMAGQLATLWMPDKVSIPESFRLVN